MAIFGRIVGVARRGSGVAWVPVAGALAGSLGLAGAVPSAAAGALDLDAVVALALARNPALAAVAERRSELLGTVREAKADIYPQVALSSGWNRSRSPALLNSPDFEDIIEAFPGFKPSEQELNTLALELQQTVYSFGKVEAGIALAQEAVDATEAQIETARLDTAAAAARAYFEDLAAGEEEAAVAAQRRARAAALAVVEARHELGDATRLELLQAEAALAEIEPLLAQAHERVAISRLALLAQLDLQEAAGIEIAPAAGELPPPPLLAEALAAALARRPEFMDLERQARALSLQQTVTRADGLPQIELTGSYGRTVRLVENLEDPLFADWRVALGLRWEFFDGGRRAAQVRQIESQKRQIASRLAELRNRVRLEVEGGLATYGTAVAQVAAAAAAAAAASEASRVASEGYAEGAALQAELLTAQERAVAAEVGRVRATYNARIQAARLSRALGLMPGAAWSGGGPGGPAAAPPEPLRRQD